MTNDVLPVLIPVCAWLFSVLSFFWLDAIDERMDEFFTKWWMQGEAEKKLPVAIVRNKK